MIPAARTPPSRTLQIRHGIWGVVMFLPAAVCVMMAVGAIERWDPYFTHREPEFGMSATLLQLQLRGAFAISLIPVLLVTAHLAVFVRRLKHPHVAPKAQLWLIGLAATVAAAPAALRVLLPWEDPYDGGGSPMATFLGIITLGILGLPFGIAGFAILIRYARTVRPKVE